MFLNSTGCICANGTCCLRNQVGSDRLFGHWPTASRVMHHREPPDCIKHARRYRGRQANPTGLPEQLAKLHRHHNVPDTTISIHTELQCKRLVIFYG